MVEGVENPQVGSLSWRGNEVDVAAMMPVVGSSNRDLEAAATGSATAAQSAQCR